MAVTHINGFFLCSVTYQLVDFGQGYFFVYLYFLICKTGYTPTAYLPVRVVVRIKEIL